MSEDLVVLREILQRELETINAYEKMLPRLADPSLRTIVAHVTDEEREHVAEMYHLILARDEKQRAVDANNDATAGASSGVARSQPAGLSVGGGNPHASGPAATQTAAAAAGLSVALISPPEPGVPVTAQVAVDPMPPPAPIFPDGAWSVGTLKGAV